MFRNTLRGFLFTLAMLLFGGTAWGACPGDSFWDGIDGGGCWSCPGGRRAVNFSSIKANNACVKDAYEVFKKARKVRKNSRIFQGCPGGSFWDVKGGDGVLGACYSCDGYRRTAYAVDHSRSCAKTIPKQYYSATYVDCYQAKACGKEGQKPCNIFNQCLPSCDRNLFEAPGVCKKPKPGESIWASTFLAFTDEIKKSVKSGCIAAMDKLPVINLGGAALKDTTEIKYFTIGFFCAASNVIDSVKTYPTLYNEASVQMRSKPCAEWPVIWQPICSAGMAIKVTNVEPIQCIIDAAKSGGLTSSKGGVDKKTKWLGYGEAANSIGTVAIQGFNAATKSTHAPTNKLTFYKNILKAVNMDIKVTSAMQRSKACQDIEIVPPPPVDMSTGVGHWKKLPGAAVDISTGSDGSVFVVGADGNSVYRWISSKNNWEKFTGGLSRIDVASDGNPVGVNKLGEIWRFDGSKWNRLPGAATDIGIGDDGTMWVVNKNHEIYRWKPGTGNWESVPGSASRIDVDADGNAWVVNKAGEIYQYTGKKWVRIDGWASDIAVGSDGRIVVVGGGGSPYVREEGQWLKVTGAVTSIAIGKDSAAWGVNASKNIYYWGE